ncbi:MAG: alpha-L-arabinofuranosidase [Bacteroidales bacterium]|nr:alpha-L-arabinofuranosidase [Bacteroidales bacterium]
MMKSFKYFLAAAAMAVALPLGAQTPQVTIKTSKAKNVSRVLYGWHYEEIGMIGDGGIYAEMVRNRNFEEANLPEGFVIEDSKYKGIPGSDRPDKHIYQIDPLVGWVTTPLGLSPIRISCTSRNPLNENNRHSMEVHVILDELPEGAAIHNRGYFGMAFRKGVPCRLSFYARADRYNGTLSFRLSDENGKAVSEAKTFTGLIGKWQKFETELTPDCDQSAGMLSIVPNGKGSFQLDMVSMFPSDTYDDGKSVFRADILQNLVDYKPDFLRFPGGCIVHGVNEETQYWWKKTIGPIEERPGEWCKWDPHYRTDGLGFHEFMEMCEYMGCAALFVVPTGMNCPGWVPRDGEGHICQPETDAQLYIDNALDAIEYAIGSVDSKWGAERAKNGHPEPFPLKYIQIGNEDEGPIYIQRYHEMYQALKKAYPQLRYMADSPLGPDNKEPAIDKFIDKSEVEIYDEHYYKGVPWAVENFHKYDSYKRQGVDIAIMELGIQNNGVGGRSGAYPGSILAEGIFKMMLERNGDLNPIMADRPLMRNWECIERNEMQPSLLNSSTVSARTFNYWMCKMLRDNKIDRSYQVTNTEGEQTLFVTAGYDNQLKKTVVKIINLSTEPQSFILKSDKSFKGRKAARTVLTAGPDQIVTPLIPDAVVPVQDSFTMPSNGRIDLPGSSFTVLVY